MPPPQKRPHIAYRPGLDGLRALAVVAVFLYHAKPQADGDPWLPGGFLGVDLFFVLSGYLITSLLLVEWEKHGRVMLIDFWRRRARRLFPAVVVVILAALALAALFGNPALNTLGKTRGDAIYGLLYFNNWHQIIANESYFGGKGSLLQHLWSLSVEEQFYILWPFLLVGGLLLVGRKRLPLLVLGGIGASAVLMWVLYNGVDSDPSRVYFGTDTRAFLLLMGALLALIWPYIERINRALPLLELLGVAALATTIYLFFDMPDPSLDPTYFHGGDLAASFCFAVLIAAVAHPASRLNHALGVFPLRWLGERSYGIYLWHYPIVMLLIPGVDWSLSGAPAILIQAALVLLAAALSYRFVEQPIRTQRLQRRLAEFGARRRTELVTAGAAALVVAFAVLFTAPISTSASPPVQTTTGTTTTSTTPTKHHHHHHHHHSNRLPPGHMLALGDSVMLGCSEPTPYLQRALDNRVKVDAVVGRQIDATITELDQYRARHRLPKIVIVQVGNNGPLLYNDLVNLKYALRGVPDIVVVNVRNDTPWESKSNQAITTWLHDWHAAHLADWYDHSTASMLSDGTHPWPYACKIYARVIKTTLRGTKA